MTKYRSREPVYTPGSPDLDLAFWKTEKRDFHGMWTKGGAFKAADAKIKAEMDADAAHREAVAAANKGASLKLIGQSSRQLTVKTPQGTLTMRETRKLYQLDHDQRESLISAAGLRSQGKYHGMDDGDLLHRAVEHPEERADIAAEIDIRQKANLAAAQTLKAGLEAEKVAGRESKWDRIDARLRKTKVGRALISIRKELETDPALDAEDKTKEVAKDKTKEYLHELATGRLIKILASSVAGLATHFISTSPDLPEKIRQLTELQPVDAGLVVAVGAVVTLATTLLSKHGKKVAKKAVEKVKLKEPVKS